MPPSPPTPHPCPQMPAGLQAGNYTLTVEAFGRDKRAGYIFKNVTQLEFQQKHVSVFIHTDKMLYMRDSTGDWREKQKKRKRERKKGKVKQEVKKQEKKEGEKTERDRNESKKEGKKIKKIRKPKGRKTVRNEKSKKIGIKDD